MQRTISFPVALLFAFSTFINFSFSFKEDKIPKKIKIVFVFKDSVTDSKTVVPEKAECTAAVDVYNVMNLESKGLSRQAFDLALKGYNHLLHKKLVHKKDIITVVDFSKPSSQKRLFVIDLKKDKIIFQSLVAHGHNSGLEYATSFSNDEDSHKSSLGFYVTMNTYSGECGYALKLKGCDKGFNDHAFERAIVIHGSQYVTDDFLHSNGFLGRSWGCPALPEKISKKIIDVIKNGSCVFLYHPTPKYLKNSPVLNG